MHIRISQQSPSNGDNIQIQLDVNQNQQYSQPQQEIINTQQSRFLPINCTQIPQDPILRLKKKNSRNTTPEVAQIPAIISSFEQLQNVQQKNRQSNDILKKPNLPPPLPPQNAIIIQENKLVLPPIQIVQLLPLRKQTRSLHSPRSYSVGFTPIIQGKIVNNSQLNSIQANQVYYSPIHYQTEIHTPINQLNSSQNDIRCNSFNHAGFVQNSPYNTQVVNYLSIPVQQQQNQQVSGFVQQVNGQKYLGNINERTYTPPSRVNLVMQQTSGAIERQTSFDKNLSKIQYRSQILNNKISQHGKVLNGKDEKDIPQNPLKKITQKPLLNKTTGITSITQLSNILPQQIPLPLSLNTANNTPIMNRVNNHIFLTQQQHKPFQNTIIQSFPNTVIKSVSPIKNSSFILERERKQSPEQLLSTVKPYISMKNSQLIISAQKSLFNIPSSHILQDSYQKNQQIQHNSQFLCTPSQPFIGSKTMSSSNIVFINQPQTDPDNISFDKNPITNQISAGLPKPQNQQLISQNQQHSLNSNSQQGQTSNSLNFIQTQSQFYTLDNGNHEQIKQTSSTLEDNNQSKFNAIIKTNQITQKEQIELLLQSQHSSEFDKSKQFQYSSPIKANSLEQVQEQQQQIKILASVKENIQTYPQNSAIQNYSSAGGYGSNSQINISPNKQEGNSISSYKNSQILLRNTIDQLKNITSFSNINEDSKKNKDSLIEQKGIYPQNTINYSQEVEDIKNALNDPSPISMKTEMFQKRLLTINTQIDEIKKKNQDSTKNIEVTINDLIKNEQFIDLQLSEFKDHKNLINFKQKQFDESLTQSQKKNANKEYQLNSLSNEKILNSFDQFQEQQNQLEQQQFHLLQKQQQLLESQKFQEQQLLQQQMIPYHYQEQQQNYEQKYDNIIQKKSESHNGNDLAKNSKNLTSSYNENEHAKMSQNLTSSNNQSNEIGQQIKQNAQNFDGEDYHQNQQNIELNDELSIVQQLTQKSIKSETKKSNKQFSPNKYNKNAVHPINQSKNKSEQGQKDQNIEIAKKLQETQSKISNVFAPKNQSSPNKNSPIKKKNISSPLRRINNEIKKSIHEFQDMKSGSTVHKAYVNMNHNQYDSQPNLNEISESDANQKSSLLIFKADNDNSSNIFSIVSSEQLDNTQQYKLQQNGQFNSKTNNNSKNNGINSNNSFHNKNSQIIHNSSYLHPIPEQKPLKNSQLNSSFSNVSSTRKQPVNQTKNQNQFKNLNQGHATSSRESIMQQFMYLNSLTNKKQSQTSYTQPDQNDQPNQNEISLGQTHLKRPTKTTFTSQSQVKPQFQNVFQKKNPIAKNQLKIETDNEKQKSITKLDHNRTHSSIISSQDYNQAPLILSNQQKMMYEQTQQQGQQEKNQKTLIGKSNTPKFSGSKLFQTQELNGPAHLISTNHEGLFNQQESNQNLEDIYLNKNIQQYNTQIQEQNNSLNGMTFNGQQLLEKIQNHIASSQNELQASQKDNLYQDNQKDNRGYKYEDNQYNHEDFEDYKQKIDETDTQYYSNHQLSNYQSVPQTNNQSKQAQEHLSITSSVVTNGLRGKGDDSDEQNLYEALNDLNSRLKEKADKLHTSIERISSGQLNNKKFLSKTPERAVTEVYENNDQQETYNLNQNQIQKNSRLNKSDIQFKSTNSSQSPIKGSCNYQQQHQEQLEQKQKQDDNKRYNKNSNSPQKKITQQELKRILDNSQSPVKQPQYIQKKGICNGQIKNNSVNIKQLNYYDETVNKQQSQQELNSITNNDEIQPKKKTYSGMHFKKQVYTNSKEVEDQQLQQAIQHSQTQKKEQSNNLDGSIKERSFEFWAEKIKNSDNPKQILDVWKMMNSGNKTKQ